MQDFKNSRKKSLDVVICRPASNERGKNLLDLAQDWDLVLTRSQLDYVHSLPEIHVVSVGEVLLALEAKACMTAHQKAKPRLYDELNSSHATVHGAHDAAIAAGFVLINTARKFISTDLNKHDMSTNPPVWSAHRADWAEQVVEKMRQLPRRSGTGEVGFDALAVIGINCTNDGVSPVSLDEGPPLPRGDDPLVYSRMIQRISTLLATRFPML